MTMESTISQFYECNILVLISQHKYMQEAYSILCLGESEGPTMLSVSRVDGTILHHLVLGHPSTGELTLYLYEKVDFFHFHWGFNL